MIEWKLLSIAGYTEIEKINIAKDHLLPKQIERTWLNKGAVCKSVMKAFNKLSVIIHVKRVYVVLNVKLASICRKAAKIIVSGEKKRVVVTEKNVEEYLGKTMFRLWPGGDRRSSRCCDRFSLYNSRR